MKDLDENVEQCRTCRYFKKLNEHDGECRRMAPIPILRSEMDCGEGALDVFWPVVDVDDWCGDWDEKC